MFYFPAVHQRVGHAEWTTHWPGAPPSGPIWSSQFSDDQHQKAHVVHTMPRVHKAVRRRRAATSTVSFPTQFGTFVNAKQR